MAHPQGRDQPSEPKLAAWLMPAIGVWGVVITIISVLWLASADHAQVWSNIEGLNSSAERHSQQVIEIRSSLAEINAELASIRKELELLKEIREILR